MSCLEHIRGSPEWHTYVLAAFGPGNLIGYAVCGFTYLLLTVLTSSSRDFREFLKPG